jgi:hypothetical protein
MQRAVAIHETYSRWHTTTGHKLQTLQETSDRILSEMDALLKTQPYPRDVARMTALLASNKSVLADALHLRRLVTTICAKELYESIDSDQRVTVERALALLTQAGFTIETLEVPVMFKLLQTTNDYGITASSSTDIVRYDPDDNPAIETLQQRVAAKNGDHDNSCAFYDTSTLADQIDFATDGDYTVTGCMYHISRNYWFYVVTPTEVS